jgi:membrane-bound lytic murein transglycosylase B
VRATFAVSERLGVSPLDLRGSASGAFGDAQFMPTSYLLYGEDGDGDGQVILHRTGDAALSAGRYLAAHGWRPGLRHPERRRVIWYYNRSDAYVETVLSLAAHLDTPASARRAPAKPRKKQPPRSQSARR